MTTIRDEINRILAQWDPIGVGALIAVNEYRIYVPIILQYINDKKLLIKCLENILVNNMGLDYDSTNEQHVKDLQQVSEKIIEIYNQQKT